jgi:hypothetical protein
MPGKCAKREPSGPSRTSKAEIEVARRGEAARHRTGRREEERRIGVSGVKVAVERSCDSSKIRGSNLKFPQYFFRRLSRYKQTGLMLRSEANKVKSYLRQIPGLPL